MKQRPANQKQSQTRQHPQPAKEHPQPVQELTEEQLQQVVGGQPNDPIYPTDPRLTSDPGATQIIIVGG